MMKFFISIIFFLLTFNLNASEYKLEKVISGLNKPWGMSFINDNELFLTQKSGEILKINLTTKEVKNFSHNLKVVQPHWQAGVLDIIYKDEEVFVSYTEDRGNDKTSTSIARGIIRDESFRILKKDDKLQHNDKAYVIVNSNQMEETLKVFGHNEKIANKILIIGGGNIGFNLASKIENNFEEARVKIIEKDKNRAEYIANYLNDTIVINGNGLDEDVLNEANLDEVETVLALTNDDEDNLMVSVLVEKFSKNKRTMALVNKPNYSLLQSSLKIDDLIDPRMSTVSSILKHVHKGTIENAYTILNGEYEVIEADILETSELVNKELKNADLPDEIRVGAILRDNKFILPSSKYIFQKDDTVVLLAKRDQLPLVENLFRISSI